VTASDHAARYDEVPYPQVVHSASHPRVIGAMATLFGLDPAPPDRCRVLDIGCASGMNLIAMAVDHPEARFVGVDISASAIAAGRAIVEELGLDNVTLVVGDLAADLDLGRFDYVLAHGVYSWIAPPLRARLLEVIRRHLDPTGVAYISYNTYPGWHIAGLLRSLFLRQTDPAAPPLTRVAQARAVLHEHIGAAVEGSVRRAVLLHEQQLLDTTDDAYLFHEYFVDDHHPVYFEDFIAEADAAELTYVSDARPIQVIPGTQPPNVAAAVQGLQDTIAIQQALDHHLNTRFRWSILCPKGDLQPRLTIDPRGLSKLHIGLPRDRELHLMADGAEVHNAAGRRITVNDRVVADILAHLRPLSPSSLPLTDLVDLADPGGRSLAGALIGLFFSNVTTLTTSPISAAATLPERPTLSALNRLQAARGFPLTNREFSSHALDDHGREVAALLDGSRDVDAVAAAMGALRPDVEGLLRVFVDASLILS